MFCSQYLDNERILKYKYRWLEADRSLDDGKLNVKELMDFRHPEQSERLISELVKDFINSLGMCYQYYAQLSLISKEFFFA